MQKLPLQQIFVSAIHLIAATPSLTFKRRIFSQSTSLRTTNARLCWDGKQTSTRSHLKAQRMPQKQDKTGCLFIARRNECLATQFQNPHSPWIKCTVHSLESILGVLRRILPLESTTWIEALVFVVRCRYSPGKKTSGTDRQVIET